MFKINKTTTKYLKNVAIGGINPITIQSMLKIKTSNVREVIKEIITLTQHGLDIIRVSILDKEDAISLKEIIPNINIPLVADIHYNLNLAKIAIENGANGIRINPGNTDLNTGEFINLVNFAKEKKVLIRIGLNKGSLPRLTNKEIIKLMLKEIKRYESLGFTNLVLSIKDSNLLNAIKLNKMLSKKTSYPLHIGLTEAGDLIDGLVSSSFFFKELLSKNIGNTIRVSLNSEPLNEVRAAKVILANLGLTKTPRIISCPRCGRNVIDLSDLLAKVKDYLIINNINLKIAIMGCNVNGPGEARDAVIGVFPVTKEKLLLYFKGEKYQEININDAYEEIITLIKKASL